MLITSITLCQEIILSLKPGFKNFDKVKEGDLLAKDKRGPIFAKKSGFLLMPLYQKEGNDGFFIVNQADQGSLS